MYGYRTLRCRTPAFTSGGAFAPTDISDLAGWWDPSDEATITESSGLVSQLDDKSGNAYHLTQGTGSLQPATGTHTINSLNVLHYPGGGDRMHFPAGLMTDIGGANDSTIFAVAAKDSASEATDSIVADQTRYRLNMNSASVYFRLDTGGTANLSPTMDTNAHIVIGQREGVNARVWYDGGTPGTEGTQVDTTLVQLRVAHQDQGFTGRIGEIIIYARALSLSEINQVLDYMDPKWAVTTSEAT